jgi:carbon storage regulator
MAPVFFIKKKGMIYMLVLSRKEGESIAIDDNITVSVLEIKGDRVRIGIDAPRAVPVFRQEIQDKRMDERTSDAK